MNISFLMLLAAAGLLRHLAVEMKRTFDRRLVNLLPRKVVDQHLAALLMHYPEQIHSFRLRVLPFSGLQIALNALACLCFAAALWFFPPSAISDWDLSFMRYGSAILVPAAFLWDAWGFARLFRSTLASRADYDERA